MRSPHIPLPDVPVVGPRQDYLVERCTDQRVLHLGCVDSGLIEERIAAGLHLHQRLASVTSDLCGIDVDEAGIERLRKAGFDNLIAGDVCDPRTLDRLDSADFEVVLASEVIEHVLDPGRFLGSLQGWMQRSGAELIVTVPNAFRIPTLLQMWKGIEYVHPDHNYWFSYVTIMNLLSKTGFTVDEVYVYSDETTSVLPGTMKRLAMRVKRERPEPRTGVRSYLRTLPRRLLARMLFSRTSFWGDGIIAVARPKET